MPLSARERTLYARHLLLAEVGSEGQERLLSCRVRASEGQDAQAVATGLSYLSRAGVEIRAEADDTAALSFAPGTDAEVEALAGRPELRAAASALRGAFAAVEIIKETVAAGRPAPFPARFCLSSEEA
jgi:hypothetical protein